MTRLVTNAVSWCEVQFATIQQPILPLKLLLFPIFLPPVGRVRLFRRVIVMVADVSQVPSLPGRSTAAKTGCICG